MNRVQGVVTKDTRKDITDLLNAYRHPFVLLALCIAESNLHEHSERYKDGCDKSCGLVHQSVCYVPRAIAQKIPGFNVATDAQGRFFPTLSNYEAMRRYFWRAEDALADAGPRISDLVDRFINPLEALCRWNKPSMAGVDNPNRANYQRALVEAVEYTREDPDEEEPVATPLVGLGALQKMKDNGDVPIRDSEFHHNYDGSEFEKAFGWKGFYLSSDAGGSWRNEGPFAYGE